MHRFNNSKEEKLKEPPVKASVNNGYNVFYVGNPGTERQKLQRGSTAPNLNNTKNNFAGKASTEIKNLCNPDTCDFWPHCAHRDSINNQTQPMMRASQSYPTHQRALDENKIETIRSSNGSMERGNQDQHRKKLSRHDTDSRSGSRRSVKSGSGTLGSESSEANERRADRRPSPSKREIERKCSPVNPKSVPSRSPSIFGNRSSSSSSSDIYVTTSDRTASKSPKTAKSSGASTPLGEMPIKDERLREEILTRPGSAPSDESRLCVPESQQRSMSLPKSFLSASYQG